MSKTSCRKVEFLPPSWVFCPGDLLGLFGLDSTPLEKGVIPQRKSVFISGAKSAAWPWRRSPQVVHRELPLRCQVAGRKQLSKDFQNKIFSFTCADGEKHLINVFVGIN